MDAFVLRREQRRIQHRNPAQQREHEHRAHGLRDLVHDVAHLFYHRLDIDQQQVGKTPDQRIRGRDLSGGRWKLVM